MNNLEKEIWKDIAGYEGYQVSNFGNVRSLDREVIYKDGRKRYFKGRVLSSRLDKYGYLYVILSKEGIHKTCKVHRLVALTFLPNTDNLPEVNHKDENKENNCLDNLEWCSSEYNLNYGTRKERSARNRCKEVLQFSLKGEYIKSFYAISEAGRITGINMSDISACCKGKYKHAGGFLWCYAS